jgi:hypothetical protein
MANEEEVHNALRRMIMGLVPHSTIVGTVKEVDETEFACTVLPLDGGAEMHFVKLKPSIDTSDFGIIPIPEVGSDVLVGIVGKNDNHAFLVMTSRVKKCLIKLNGSIFEIDSSGIKLNGDSYGGLIKIQSLINELKLFTQFNNAFKKAIQLWIPVSGDGGAAFKAQLQQLMSLHMPEFIDIENKKVKHGG